MEDKKPKQNMMRYAGLATQWMVMMLIGVWAGYKLDGALKWSIPLFVILFPLISLAVSMWQLMKELNNSNKK